MIMEYRYIVEHQVITQTEIIVRTDKGQNQAESNMLKRALDLGLDVKSWRVISEPK